MDRRMDLITVVTNKNPNGSLSVCLCFFVYTLIINYENKEIQTGRQAHSPT